MIFSVKNNTTERVERAETTPRQLVILLYRSTHASGMRVKDTGVPIDVIKPSFYTYMYIQVSEDCPRHCGDAKLNRPIITGISGCALNLDRTLPVPPGGTFPVWKSWSKVDGGVT